MRKRFHSFVIIPFLFIGFDIGILDTISYGVFKLNNLALSRAKFCINCDGDEFMFDEYGFVVVDDDDDDDDDNLDCCCCCCPDIVPSKLSVII